MTARSRTTTYVSVSRAVRLTGLSRYRVQQCVARELVRKPLSDADLAQLRRIRRLQELGVNMQGIEIILHMRQRVQALQAELVRWERSASERERRSAEERWQHLLSWESD